jgi:hypothetical protein
MSYISATRRRLEKRIKSPGEPSWDGTAGGSTISITLEFAHACLVIQLIGNGVPEASSRGAIGH